MKSLNVTLVRNNINKFMDEVYFHSARYFIMKNGNKRAVVMSAAEYEELVEYNRDKDEERMKK